MSEKIINIGKQITNLEGVVITKEDGAPFTVGDALLTYIRHSQSAHLTEEELNTVYVLGLNIGKVLGTGTITVNGSQFKVIDKLVRSKFSTPNGKEEYLFTLEVRMAVIQAIEESENAK